MRNDDDLKELFQRRRRLEARSAPPFERLLQAANGRSHPWPLAAAYLAAALVLIATISWWWLGPKAPTTANQPLQVVASSWNTPSDFLLEVPGRELLKSPSFGTGWPATALSTESSKPRQREPQPIPQTLEKGYDS